MVYDFATVLTGNLKENLLGGNMDASIYDTIRRFMGAGMTLEQAIEKWEGTCHVTLPSHIKVMVYEEVK